MRGSECSGKVADQDARAMKFDFDRNGDDFEREEKTTMYAA